MGQNYWTFSAPFVWRDDWLCTDNAELENEHNKWRKIFKKTRKDINEPKENRENHPDRGVLSVSEAHLSNAVGSDTENLQEEDEFVEKVDKNPNSLDYVVEKCQRNQDLIIALGRRLSPASSEKLCQRIFDQAQLNLLFVHCFYQFFFPEFFKREYSWVCVDLLVKANEAYPMPFKSLLQVLLKDTSVPSKILRDYVETLSDDAKTELMVKMAEVDFKPEEFSHHLPTIYYVYKGSAVTELVQRFILGKLIDNSNRCTTDRHYGRLLMEFLQHHKCMGMYIDSNILERVIDAHNSPFKRPCRSIMNSLLDRFAYEM